VAEDDAADDLGQHRVEAAVPEVELVLPLAQQHLDREHPPRPEEPVPVDSDRPRKGAGQPAGQELDQLVVVGFQAPGQGGKGVKPKRFGKLVRRPVLRHYVGTMSSSNSKSAARKITVKSRKRARDRRTRLRRPRLLLPRPGGRW